MDDFICLCRQAFGYLQFFISSFSFQDADFTAPPVCKILSALTAFSALSSSGIANPTPSATTSAVPAAFTYNATTFLLHGEPYIIMGGQMDPHRIPYQYWRDRLAKARAMGINTILSYVSWNTLEPEPGMWLTSEPQNDVAAWFKIAQEEGLNVILRPGPYICGEHEWGGFPYWLSTIPNLTVRTYNEKYLHYANVYLEKLAAELRPLQVTEGGPLLMVQVENEYGSYGSNHNYTSALKDTLVEIFDVPLYTNDGSVWWTLAGGTVPGVLAEIDGGPTYGFPARDLYVTDPSQLGPLFDGEYYTLAPDNWGAKVPHQTTVGNPADVEAFISDLNFVLNVGNSISLYMFHGGTNFGLSNGAIWQNYSKVFTTSYDYGAPLDESGRTTDLYFTLREVIAQYFPNESIPIPPANIPMLEIPSFVLTPMAPLFNLDRPTVSMEYPVTMEYLGQAYGFILYEHQVTEAVSGLLLPGDRARDRVIIYINGVKSGVIDSTYVWPQNNTISLEEGDKLQLFVENLGRVDYFSPPSYTYDALLDPYKGILTNVTVNGTILSGWNMYSYPVNELPTPSAVSNISSPVYYSGSFFVNGTAGIDPSTLDTFIAIPNGVKGIVWVNDFMLGRYWIVGPQQSLYLPGTVLMPGAWNDIVVLELEPTMINGTMIAEGQSERIWGNYPDPDWP
ncbi:beta-galactosidase-2 [Coleophoma crateriformis]|uniref:Beta-galactosidase n=1 Tax=Coleophoma crateriformis TaxID=565419 RepID=A0A3D8RDX1_9HELO|nr:beta-galactosidase-2 [Coleophoma crateriformis]